MRETFNGRLRRLAPLLYRKLHCLPGTVLALDYLESGTAERFKLNPQILTQSWFLSKPILRYLREHGVHRPQRLYARRKRKPASPNTKQGPCPPRGLGEARPFSNSWDNMCPVPASTSTRDAVLITYHICVIARFGSDGCVLHVNQAFDLKNLLKLPQI
jgi:hypothetical protein